ncbi:MAG: class A beta-lactamase [Nonomuraea sp.]|nr:class A beta-lactamase [Nonomuraea sp.]
MGGERGASVERFGPSRRALLAAGALLPLAACGTDERPPAGAAVTTTGSPAPRTSKPSGKARFAALERRYGARLGVYAVATGTGATLAHRADERFAFCSTFKSLAAAAVLHRNPLRHLDERVTYTSADVDSISPITRDHVATGLTIRQLCDAAIRYSDGTAGNLLMRDIGGPAALTAFLRELGDTVSRVDHYEPELNRMRPKDPRDTTTPRMIAADHRALLLGDTLSARKRALLQDWLERVTTGAARVKAGLPKGWRLAHKTGTGNYGRAHDVAVVWPPGAAPLVLAVMTDRSGYDTPPKEKLIAEATRLIVAELT